MPDRACESQRANISRISGYPTRLSGPNSIVYIYLTVFQHCMFLYAAGSVGNGRVALA